MLKKVVHLGEEYYEDSNGWKQGEFSYREPDGYKTFECMYVDDLMHGEFKKYHGRPQDGVTSRGICINDEQVEILEPRKEYDGEEKVILALKYGCFSWLDSSR